MIQVNITLQSEHVKELIEGLSDEIHFLGKKGFALSFSTPDDSVWLPQIKSALKNDPILKALYFSVTRK